MLNLRSAGLSSYDAIPRDQSDSPLFVPVYRDQLDSTRKMPFKGGVLTENLLYHDLSTSHPTGGDLEVASSGVVAARFFPSSEML